jgi:hypothetical protein
LAKDDGIELMYDATDPRASLASPAPAATGAGSFAGPDIGRFYAEPGIEDGPGVRSWLLCGENMVVVHTVADGDATLIRTDQVDEYAIIAPEPGTPLEITHGGEAVSAPGNCLVFVPPGVSTVRLPSGGTITRVFTTRSRDLVAQCPNAAAHAVPNARVAPIDPWPEPPSGWRVRTYPLDVAAEPGRFGRIWRCTTLMINYLDPRNGPRDPAKLSPHSHEDFEQCSLALTGDFVHHLRWPWTTNMHDWRDDMHERCSSPSVCVIPPPSIHTTQAVGAGVNQLVDLFCPPRLDFSRKPGWVLNEADYPMRDEFSGPQDIIYPSAKAIITPI